MSESLKCIVLTGGPCAGKTTALVRVVEHFSTLGYKVFTVPEVPTMITTGGWNYLTSNPAFYFQGELSILRMQLALEEEFRAMAATVTDQPCVLICDRGALDISAYISPETWKALCDAVGHTPDTLRARYDAVLHLVSAADGAEKFYTTANNAQRYEQADEAGLQIARDLDKKVMTAWEGHPHLRVINNGEDFERKMKRVLKEISIVLELPLPVEEERKYLVEVTGEVQGTNRSLISQTYLAAEPGCEIRIRCRSWNDFKRVYTHTTRKVSGAEELITERIIEAPLYESLLKQKDPYRHTVKKDRKTFIYQGQFFELDTYHDALEGLTVLETKGIASHEEIKFPPFLKVIRDITGNPEFYNYNLSLK